jgi:hypothetical protein
VRFRNSSQILEFINGRGVTKWSQRTALLTVAPTILLLRDAIGWPTYPDQRSYHTRCLLVKYMLGIFA